MATLRKYPRDVTLPQFLLDNPSRLSGQPMLIDDVTGRSYDLNEIRGRVEAVARAVKAKWNIGPGDVVCLYSENCLDYPVVIWAMHRLGAIVTCANPSYTASELLYQLEQTKARLIFASAGSLPKALDAIEKRALLGKDELVLFSPPSPAKSSDTTLARPRPADDSLRPQSQAHVHEGHAYPTVQQLCTTGRSMAKNYIAPTGSDVGDKVAFLSFSSGTTGLPKAVAIAHRGLVANVLQCRTFLQDPRNGFGGKDFARPGDRALGVLPLYHIYGLAVCLHLALYCGLGLVLIPKFNLESMLDSIVRHRITHLYIVPPMAVMMLNSLVTKRYNICHVRYCLIGAAPISAGVTKRFEALIPGMRMGQAYGMTETVVVFHFRHPTVSGSAGVVLPDTEAQIVLPSGKLAGPNESGEVWVRGPQMALGYANDVVASKETFREDGWVRTGDEGRIDENGNLWVLDRLKEFLKVNGYQVAPAELEGHLILHPYVSDAGVIGIPDEVHGELPVAFIVLSAEGGRVAHGDETKSSKRGGEDRVKQHIRRWVERHKVRYKWLDGGVAFVGEIPRNPSGKILRRVLKEQLKRRTIPPSDQSTPRGKL